MYLKNWVCLVAILIAQTLFCQDTTLYINDYGALNRTHIKKILRPISELEIQNCVKSTYDKISIGGGKYSMGGQTLYPNSIHIDMREMDSIITFSEKNKTITVQAGITWRKIQNYLIKYNLSISIMQTYANFTVGGSLSVNVHGRYLGNGALISSVNSIKIILANGELIAASPDKNSEIFYGAIGGYGGLGIITEATLKLVRNDNIIRVDKKMKTDQYYEYFNTKMTDSIIFHNADLYPNKYKKIRAVNYIATNKPVTKHDSIMPWSKNYPFNRFTMRVVSDFPGGKSFRKNIIDPIRYLGKPIYHRNFEASYDVNSLEPKSRVKSTYLLQEYFVPVKKFDTICSQMISICKKYNVNIINISIRHAKSDSLSLLSWAKTDVFSFVIFYKQKNSIKGKEIIKLWTNELVELFINAGGSFYLPYQTLATKSQFLKAYPNAPLFFKLKKKVDPTNKFTNKLWSKYYN